MEVGKCVQKARVGNQGKVGQELRDVGSFVRRDEEFLQEGVQGVIRDRRGKNRADQQIIRAVENFHIAKVGIGVGDLDTEFLRKEGGIYFKVFLGIQIAQGFWVSDRKYSVMIEADGDERGHIKIVAEFFQIFYHEAPPTYLAISYLVSDLTTILQKRHRKIKQKKIKIIKIKFILKYMCEKQEYDKGIWEE